MWVPSHCVVQCIVFSKTHLKEILVFFPVFEYFSVLYIVLFCVLLIFTSAFYYLDKVFLILFSL